MKQTLSLAKKHNNGIKYYDGAGRDNLNFTDGPGLHEMDGLDIEERKRKRTRLNETMDMNKNSRTTKPDLGFLKMIALNLHLIYWLSLLC